MLAVLLFAISKLSAQQQQVVTQHGHIDSADIFKLYYIPVDVPNGITEIQVHEDYSAHGKNVLNIGIFDSNGYEVERAGAGFRGWSGGAKTSFFINEQEASTGYMPGKIYQGTWYVLIYASTIIRKGLDWKLDVTLISGKHRPLAKNSVARSKINNTAGWYRGDLHMHTLHSDGKRTQQELTDEAAEKHLNYIISTEHNTNSANRMWGKYEKDSLLIINGEEVTTTAYGHWNAIGLKPQTWIEWRYIPTDGTIERYIKQVHQDGGLCIINHPFYTKNFSNGFAFDPNLFDGIEVWNGNWDALDALALKWWDGFLKKGKHMLVIGASDTHKASGSPNNLGEPQTMVYAPSLSQDGILQGLKRGKAYITSSANIQLMLTARGKQHVAGIGDILSIDKNEKITVDLNMMPVNDATIFIIGTQGIIKSVKATEQVYSWQLKPGTSTYLRLELHDSHGQMLALTNPIWINVK